MSTLLMNLRNVPDDEIEEVRDLLAAHHIDFYETEPHHWGVSMGAIWLRDESRLEEARHLIYQYQQHRHKQAREAYERRRRAGTAETLIDAARRHPLQTLVYVGVIAFILYLSTLPFLRLGD